MNQLLHSKYVYLLDTMDYNQALYSGPPLSVPCSAVKEIFSTQTLKKYIH